jgi:hypothetical protein
MEEPTQPLTHELGPMSRTADTHPEPDQHQNSHIQVLPPVDRGPGAWKFLFASFLIEALLWGKESDDSVVPSFSRLTLIARVPTQLWCLPRLLFASATIPRQPKHRRHRHVVHEHILLGGSLRDALCEEISALATPHGRRWFGLLRSIVASGLVL